MCECIKNIDGKLERHGYKTSSVAWIEGGEEFTIPIISLERIALEGSTRRPVVLCKFCPICGEQILPDRGVEPKEHKIEFGALLEHQEIKIRKLEEENYRMKGALENISNENNGGNLVLILNAMREYARNGLETPSTGRRWVENTGGDIGRIYNVRSEERVFP